MAKDKKQEKKKKLPPGVRERDGRYTYRYSVPVIVDGKKKRKQKETEAYPTAQEAYEAGILIKADQLRGKLIDEKNTTLGEWAKRWLEDHIIERELRGYTPKTKRTGLNSIIKYLGEHTKLKDVTLDDYQRWLNDLKKKGRKKNTLIGYNQAAGKMFADAAKKKVITENPAAKAEIPAFKMTLEEIEAGGNELPQYMEKGELKQFLNYIRFRGSVQDYNFFVILAYTGMRIGELQALKTTDVNETERYISITKTLIVDSGLKNYKLGPPKNTPSIRKVTIGDTVIKAYKSQLAWRAQKIKDGGVIHDADFLFWGTVYPGYPISADSLEYRFAKYIEAIGLPQSLTPHSLRHTHVTLLAEAGEQLVVIQERLGHKDDDTTRRIYLHVTEGQKRLVPDKFEKLMNA